ncbi:Abi family protein [Capnocytophaga sp. ARDL2]|uniref:Abi family protein n=1 Tax=Capnocytophaga sp. ARDL2 TaxID=3238809 RepID=UPI003558A46B
MKKATTVEEQIEILKSRGMILDLETEEIKKILLNIGYYRLGFYWHYFQVNKEHQFKENTKFSDVIALYNLDANLRSLLMNIINQIEINFRTKLIYWVSNEYKESPTWFADTRIVERKYVEDLEKIYDNKFKTNNKAIQRHHLKYINDLYAPAWKTLEFFTFGNIVYLYKNLKNKELKAKIAKEFGIKKVHIFENFIQTTIFIRNISAHGNILYDCNTSKRIEKFPLIDFENEDRHNLKSCIKVIFYLLGTFAPESRIMYEKKFGSYISKIIDNNDVIKQILKRGLI